MMVNINHLFPLEILDREEALAMQLAAEAHPSLVGDIPRLSAVAQDYFPELRPRIQRLEQALTAFLNRRA